MYKPIPFQPSSLQYIDTRHQVAVCFQHCSPRYISLLEHSISAGLEKWEAARSTRSRPFPNAERTGGGDMLFAPYTTGMPAITPTLIRVGAAHEITQITQQSNFYMILISQSTDILLWDMYHNACIKSTRRCCVIASQNHTIE